MSSFSIFKEFLALSAMMVVFYLWALFGFAAVGG